MARKATQKHREQNYQRQYTWGGSTKAERWWMWKSTGDIILKMKK